ncbi:hypothetical protein [uncultured Friedmanniella sp.]
MRRITGAAAAAVLILAGLAVASTDTTAHAAHGVKVTTGAHGV